MGWMHDMLDYVARPIFAVSSQPDHLQPGLCLCRNFVSLSHMMRSFTEGLHAAEMPGDEWQNSRTAASLRFMFGHPGKNFYHGG